MGEKRLQHVVCYKVGNMTGFFGFGGMEGEVKICSQHTCFPSLVGWCVQRECLLVLEAGIIV